MLIVPIQPVPSQQVNTNLSGQSCTINIYQKGGAVYVDLFVNNAPIITGVVAEDANVIVRSAYLGFIGDLAFFDTQPEATANGPVYSDPVYTGLGSQYVLAYLAPSDLPAGLS